MATSMAPNDVTTGATGRQEAATPLRLTTTLYDLMIAIQAMVGADDDALVMDTVVYLLRSGRLTFLVTRLASAEATERHTPPVGGANAPTPCTRDAHAGIAAVLPGASQRHPLADKKKKGMG